MAGITGLGTTFNLPNYIGELFAASPTDTPLLSAIGGLTGGEKADGVIFQWQGYDLRDASASRQRTEGADAPTREARVRFNVHNVVEIHQEAVAISYTKQAATGQYNSTGSNHAGAVGLRGDNPVLDEASWQIDQHLKQVARDIEISFIQGEFQNPSDNSNPRKTRGLLEAISTNAVDAQGEDLSRDLVLDLMQQVWENGGIAEGETATLIVNATQKRRLTDIFVNEKYTEGSRNVGGVNVRTIETDFGTVNVMLNRYVPSDTLIVCSLEQLAPVFLEIPGKGFLFVEPLAKTGAKDEWQLYGEVGLKYGNEKAHGKLTNLATTLDSSDSSEA